jgi:hypothetical protein
MKQTAVEWLGEKILELGNSYELPEDDIDELIIKAKEMDEQKMIEFAQSYAVIHCMGDITKDAEQYYNETYKSEQ